MYDGDVIDPHHHFWELRRSYPWLQGPANPDRFTGDDSAIRVDYLPADLRRDFAGLRLVGTVHVDAGAGDAGEEAQWLQSLHDADGLPTAIVAGADLLATDAPAHLERVAALPAVRGVRHILNYDPDPHVTYVARDDIMADRTWRANLARLAGLGLRFDLQIYPRQMRQAAQVAHEHGDVFFVLNHTGMPLTSDADHVALWRAGIDALAALPNTAVKISGLGMTHHDWTPETIRPFVRHAIEAFGPSRAMFASNFPVDSLYSDLATLYEAYDQLTRDLSATERDELFAATARRVYDLPTDPAPAPGPDQTHPGKDTP